MAALLVVLAVMSLMLSMALPVWHHAAQREREAELIFRGEQYARAIMLYQRQTPGAYPPDVETLVEGRFLRRAYPDPMTAGGEFRFILQSELAEFSGPGAAAGAPDDGEPEEAGDGPRRQRRREDVRDRPGFMRGVRPFANRGERTPGGADGNIAGVVSRSEETSIALYNGQSRYSDWVFLGEGPAAGQAGGESGRPEPGLSDPFGGRSGSGAGARMGGLEQRGGGSGR
jgi:type II secretory pathway pseudopilin PulG